jgi:hypothetical protein
MSRATLLLLLFALSPVACVAPVEVPAVQADDVKACCQHVYSPSYSAAGVFALAAVGQCPSAPPSEQCTPYVPALPGDGADFVCEVQADGGSFTPNPDGGIPVSFCF